MSIVENLINQITEQSTGGITKPQGFDMNDDTFEKLLQKSMGNIGQNIQTDAVSQLGAPAGFIIEPFDSPQSVAEVKPINTEELQIKDIDMSDFITNVIRTQDEENKGIFDLAKKHAANAYNSFAGKYVADLRDFIGGTLTLS